MRCRFKSDKGFGTADEPDVKVVLYRGNTVPVNPDAADYVAVGALKAFKGDQEYVLDSNLDLSQFGAVAIWCREFNVTFGYAAL